MQDPIILTHDPDFASVVATHPEISIALTQCCFSGYWSWGASIGNKRCVFPNGINDGWISQEGARADCLEYLTTKSLVFMTFSEIMEKRGSFIAPML